MTRHTLRAEALKAVTGRAWWILLAVGAAMSALTSYGYAVDGAATGAGAGQVTGDVVRAWMMVFLPASILGALLHTRDQGCGGLARSILAAPHGRAGVAAARLVVATAAGAAFGVAATVGALVSVAAFPASQGLPVVWSGDATLTTVGVLACPVLAAAFGLAVGAIVRNTATATGVLLATTLLVDPGLQRLAPRSAAYLFTIALSGVYRDPKPDVLSMPAGVAVAAVWIVVLSAVAYRLSRSRDVV